jgi:hypothetical protein
MPPNTPVQPTVSPLRSGDLSQIESAENLRDEVLNKVGRLDAVVASINSRWNEDIPLVKTSCFRLEADA